jgi:hypothetical protein
MRHPAAKLAVWFVGLCEILLGLWFALYLSTGPSDFSSRQLSLGVPAALMTAFLATGICLIFRRSWAWYLSVLVTSAFLCAGILFVMSSTGSDYYAITEGSLFIGMGAYFGVPGLLGLLLLCMQDTRNYVLHKRKRRRRSRKVDEYGQEQPTVE